MTYRRRIVVTVTRLDLHSSPADILDAMRLAYRVAESVRRYARFPDFSRRSNDNKC